MKKLLSLVLIATTLLACSAQEELSNNSTNAGKTSLSVKIDLSKFNTRSGDGAITATSDWSQLLLVAKKDSEVREKLVTKGDFTTASGMIQIFEKESVNFTGGTVEAYIIATGNDWGTITTLPTANLPVLAAGQTDINNWQPSGFIKTGIAGKLVNVPYYGSGVIIDNGPGGDGHHQLSAKVSVTPELGRIQVLKAPQSGGSKTVGATTTTVTSITVQNIYINKMISNGAPIDIRTTNSGTNVVTGGQWVNDFYAAGKTLAGMTDTGTDKGYQIFDGSKPHVIVKIAYQLNNDTQKSYEGYLTLQKFSYAGVNSSDLTVEKGKIYNIDLSKIIPTYDQIGDDPYDNTVYYDLQVEVEVKDWSMVEVTPEL